MGSKMSLELESPVVGRIPSNWKIVALHELCNKIGTGATPRGGSKVYLDSRINHALVRSQHVFDRSFDYDGLAFITDDHAVGLRNAEIKSNDILLNITGDGVTFARSCIVPNDVLPACVNQHVAIIRVNTEYCEPGYLLSFLTHPNTKTYIESFNAGGSRRAITKGHIESFEIPLPPLNEQKAIAHILSTLDDKIELNRRMSETLESMAQALFKSWFVDFDPVIDNALAAGNPIPDPLRARAEMRRALGDQRKPLPDEIQKLFPDAFVFDNEMGWIPKGWKSAELAGLCEKITDGAHRSPPSVDNGLPMASVKDMHNWGFTLDDCRQISKEEFDKLIESGCQPKRGDVLLAKDGAKCLETVCEFQQDDEIVLLSSVAIFRPKLAALSPFLHIWFGLGSTQFYLKEGFVSGSAIPRAVLRDLKKARLLCPTEGILEAFAKTVNPTRKRVWATIEKSSVLTKLRDTLLPKLLSGELRIPEAEKLVANSL